MCSLLHVCFSWGEFHAHMNCNDLNEKKSLLNMHHGKGATFKNKLEVLTLLAMMAVTKIFSTGGTTF